MADHAEQQAGLSDLSERALVTWEEADEYPAADLERDFIVSQRGLGLLLPRALDKQVSGRNIHQRPRSVADRLNPTVAE